MSDDTKKCPFCAEDIKIEAVKCKHCGSMLVEQSQQVPVPVIKERKDIESEELETTFFKEPNVKITNTRVIISGKTYAVKNITSVEIDKKRAYGITSGDISTLSISWSKPGIACLVIGVGIPVMATLSQEAPTDNLSLILLGLIFGFVGIMLVVKSHPVTTWGVRLVSSSMEQQILTSKDEQYIRKIVDAINKAIVNNK